MEVKKEEIPEEEEEAEMDQEETAEMDQEETAEMDQEEAKVIGQEMPIEMIITKEEIILEILADQEEDKNYPHFFKKE